jgi:GNAT superfamily N-acetyltransferase
MIRQRIPSRDDKHLVTLIENLLLPYTQKTDPNARIDLKSLRKRLNGTMTYVAHTTGPKAVGFISLLQRNHILFVDMLAIDRRFQNMGLGSEFMEKAESIARTLGCSELALWVDESNIRAQQFYAAKGYRFSGYQPRIRCYLMSKSV